MNKHEFPDIQGLSCPRCGGRVDSAGEFDLYRCQYCETTLFLNATDANIIFQPAAENGAVPENGIDPEDIKLEYERLLSRMDAIRKQLDRPRLSGWMPGALLVLGILSLGGILYFWIVDLQYISLALIGISTPILVSLVYRRQKLHTQRQELELKLEEYEREVIRLESNIQSPEEI